MAMGLNEQRYSTHVHLQIGGERRSCKCIKVSVADQIVRGARTLHDECRVGQTFMSDNKSAAK